MGSALLVCECVAGFGLVLSPIISYMTYFKFGYLANNVSIGILLLLVAIWVSKLLQTLHIDAVYTKPNRFLHIIWEQCSVFVSFISIVIVLTLLSFLYSILTLHLKIEWPNIFDTTTHQRSFIVLYFLAIGGTYVILSPLSSISSNYLGSLKTVIVGMLIMTIALIILAVHMLDHNSWLNWPSIVDSSIWQVCFLLVLSCLCLLLHALYIYFVFFFNVLILMF